MVNVYRLFAMIEAHYLCLIYDEAFPISFSNVLIKYVLNWIKWMKVDKIIYLLFSIKSVFIYYSLKYSQVAIGSQVAVALQLHFHIYIIFPYKSSVTVIIYL